LSSVQTKNMCTGGLGGRAAGLLALSLCRDPTTGEPLESNEWNNCEDKAAKVTTCCINPDEVPDGCPIVGEKDYLYDYENYLETGGRVQNLVQTLEDRLCPIVRGTFWEPCRYNEDDFSLEIEAQCTRLEELNEFAECQQGCDEIRPNTDTTDTETETDSDDEDIDYYAYDIADLGGRTDSIGGKPKQKRCGTRSVEKQVLPGSEVFTGEFPWACSVFKKRQYQDEYLGGCAIIPNERDNSIQRPTYRVITAASKVTKPKSKEPLEDNLIVRVRFTDKGKNAGTENDYKVATFKIPDGSDGFDAFHPSRLKSNIATMILTKPINLVKEEGVNAACLPACDNMFSHTFTNNTGVRCWSAGFGAIQQGGDNQFKLNKVDIPIYPDKYDCQEKINKALEAKRGRKGRKTNLHAGEVCAGGEAGKDTCEGDGGSPLVCQAVSGRWHVVGLVSWGIGCGEEGLPAIYTNVFHYIDFIYSLPTPQYG